MNSDTIFQKMLSRGNIAGLPIFQVSLDSEDDIATFDPGQVPNGTLIFFSIPSTGRGVIMQWDSIAGTLIEPGGVGSMDGETIATLLDEYLESDEWRGGDTAMTGEAITTAIDNYLGTSWRDAVTGQDVISALNSEIGNSWVMRAFERTPHDNINKPPVDSMDSPVGTINGNTMSFGAVAWANGGVTDGIFFVDMLETTFTVPSNTWAFPTSTMTVTVTHTTDTYLFTNLLQALAANSHWAGLPNSRVLDCGAVSALASGFFDSNAQAHIETLIEAGWTINTPSFNVPITPWVQLTGTGINNSVQIDGIGDLYLAQGDNGVTLDGDGLYYCEGTSSLDPNDWVSIGSDGNTWPLRGSYLTAVNSYEFFVTYSGSSYYAVKP
jgi:hypothetical protein